MLIDDCLDVGSSLCCTTKTIISFIWFAHAFFNFFCPIAWFFDDTWSSYSKGGSWLLTSGGGGAYFPLLHAPLRHLGLRRDRKISLGKQFAEIEEGGREGRPNKFTTGNKLQSFRCELGKVSRIGYLMFWFAFLFDKFPEGVNFDFWVMKLRNVTFVVSPLSFPNKNLATYIEQIGSPPSAHIRKPFATR